MLKIEQFDINLNFNFIENICNAIKFFFWELIPKIIRIIFNILNSFLILFMDLLLRIILINKIIKSGVEFNIKNKRNKIKSK
jgi:hypothetical protein